MEHSLRGSEDGSEEEISRRRRCRVCLERNNEVHVKNHCSIKVCEKLVTGWFFIGIGLALAGLTFMVFTIKEVKPNICKWHVWILYFLSVIVTVFSVGLISRSVASCIRFVISECQITGFDFPSTPSIENSITTSFPQPRLPTPSSTLDESQNHCGRKIVVYAEVHKAQDSRENDSLCNFIPGFDSETEINYRSPCGNGHNELGEPPSPENSDYFSEKEGETHPTLGDLT